MREERPHETLPLLDHVEDGAHRDTARVSASESCWGATRVFLLIFGERARAMVDLQQRSRISRHGAAELRFSQDSNGLRCRLRNYNVGLHSAE